MAVDWMWLGAVTDDGITVSANLTASDTTPRLAVSTEADMSSPTYFAGSASDATIGGHRIKIAAAGLDPRTRYWCQIELDAGLDTGFTGKFWTLPLDGSASSYTFGHVSCTETIPTQDITSGDAASVQLWSQTGTFFHLGDLHYLNDGTTGTVSLRAGYIDDQLNGAQLGKLFYAQPVVYIHDDHDFGDNNAIGTSASNANQNLAFRATVPHYPLADSTYGVGHSYQIGRVLVIATDLRSFRDANNATDDSSKTMMGDSSNNFDQKAWFKDQLDTARDSNCSAVVWLNSQVWPSDGTGLDNDEWHSFSTERQEIADYLNADPTYPKVIALAGDMHSSARKKDTDYSTAGDGVGSIDVFQCASLSKSGNYRGSSWDSGPVQGDGQFARLCFRETADGLWLDWETTDEPFTGSATERHWINYQISEPITPVVTDASSDLVADTFADGTSASKIRALV